MAGPLVERIREMVFEWFTRQENGAADFELYRAFPTFEQGTLRARRIELSQEKPPRLRDTDRRARTPSRRWALVREVNPNYKERTV